MEVATLRNPDLDGLNDVCVIFDVTEAAQASLFLPLFHLGSPLRSFF